MRAALPDDGPVCAAPAAAPGAPPVPAEPPGGAPTRPGVVRALPGAPDAPQAITPRYPPITVQGAHRMELTPDRQREESMHEQAVSYCFDCETAAHLHKRTGSAVVCVCGTVHAPDDFRWPAEVTRPLPPSPRSPARAPRLVTAPALPDDDALHDVPVAPLSPLARAGAAALALVPDDPELARVRMVLADLRPDCPDPLEPPVVDAGPSLPPVTIRDPSASWGGVPRGVGFGADSPVAAAALDGRCYADVVRELAELPADARAVLRWLRVHGSLAEGLRGLYVDAGMAFASAEQSAAWADLGARREGAPMHGRRLVLAAATAWGR